jgi:uncharacterized protein YegP (UPF0339 family)
MKSNYASLAIGRSVLTVKEIHEQEGYVVLGQDGDDEGRRLYLPMMDWNGLGDPMMVTVAFVAGNLLNEPHFKIVPYKDKRGQWRTRVVANNGRIVFDSAEGYHNKGDAINIAKKALTFVPVEEEE